MKRLRVDRSSFATAVALRRRSGYAGHAQATDGCPEERAGAPTAARSRTSARNNSSSSTDSVQVRGGLWFGRPWYVRDLTIVSASAPAALPAPAVLPDAPAASPGDAVAPPDEPPNPPADDPS